MAKKAAQKVVPADEVVVFDCEQGSEDWFGLRIGLPTASNFSDVLAQGKDGGESIGRQKYMDRLAGERLTGRPDEDVYRSFAMDRGNAMEPRAREWYERNHFEAVTPVGFVKRTVTTSLGYVFSAGCSPDSLINDDRILEIKTMAPRLLVAAARSNGGASLPTPHRAQIQGNLWVTGRRACELTFFYDEWKSPFKFTIERDEDFIQKRLVPEIEAFCWELDKLVEQVKAAGKGWK